MSNWLIALPGWLAFIGVAYDKLASWRSWYPYDLCRHWARKKQCDMCKDEPKWTDII